MPAIRGVGGPARAVTLVILDRSAQETARYGLQGAIMTLGRQGADLNFPDDAYLSPIHAQFVLMDGTLLVRDLGSRNGTWVYLEHPHRLSEGELVLVGSQVLRYRRLGYPGPRPPEADNTRRLGSLTPQADIANLAQIRSDGSARDTMHLSPGRTLRIGREQGDWQFPYDPSMSALHASIRSEDADFVIADEGSRNGVALAIRAEYALADKTRLLVGDQLIRVEFA
jgi:pSer/pThr/pTyr-binding forkhead associated (FHA) protein